MLKKLISILINILGVFVILLALITSFWAYSGAQAMLFCSSGNAMEKFPKNYYCTDYGPGAFFGVVVFGFFLILSIVYIVYLIKRRKKNI